MVCLNSLTLLLPNEIDRCKLHSDFFPNRFHLNVGVKLKCVPGEQVDNTLQMVIYVRLVQSSDSIADRQPCFIH